MHHHPSFFYTSTFLHVLSLPPSLPSFPLQEHKMMLLSLYQLGWILCRDKNVCRTRIIPVDCCKKMQKAEQISGDSESSTSGSPSVHRTSSSQQKQLSFDLRDGRRRSVTGRKGEELSPLAGRSLPESTQAGDLFSATAKGRRPPPVRTPPCIWFYIVVIYPHPKKKKPLF